MHPPWPRPDLNLPRHAIWPVQRIHQRELSAHPVAQVAQVFYLMQQLNDYARLP